MRLTIAYSKIKKRNLVLINNDTYQRETVSKRPIRQPLSSQGIVHSRWWSRGGPYGDKHKQNNIFKTKKMRGFINFSIFTTLFPLHFFLIHLHRVAYNGVWIKLHISK